MTEISLGIEAASYYLPQVSRSIDDWVKANNISPDHSARMRSNQLDTYFISKEETVTDMAVATIEKVLAASSLVRDSIDLIIFTHSARYSAPPGLQSAASTIQSACGLNNALSFTIAQKNCVSILTAIHVVKAMMIDDSNINHALVVCADAINETIDHMRVIDDYAIHSDGAAALLLSRHSSKNKIKAVSSVGEGKLYHGNVTNPEPNKMFFLSNVALIKRVLREAKMDIGDVDIIVPDNSNLPGWKKVIQLLRVAPEKLYVDNFSKKGHVFCSDVVINFIDSATAFNANKAKNILVCINGLSGCYGAMLIQR